MDAPAMPRAQVPSIGSTDDILDEHQSVHHGAFPRSPEVSRMLKLSDLKVKLFTDGADKAQILEMAAKPWIKGFTTNPSLLKKAGVSDYAAYARDLVAAVPDRHISFEVFSDDILEMVAPARGITTWGKNVHTKLSLTTTRGGPPCEAVPAPALGGVEGH